jgi:hypothetical protein
MKVNSVADFDWLLRAEVFQDGRKTEVEKDISEL